MKTSTVLILGLAGVVGVFVIVGKMTHEEPKSGPAMPLDESNFCSMVDGYAGSYASEGPEGSAIRKTQLRAERGAALRGTTGGDVTNWVGTIQKLDTTRDGLAYLYVKLPCKASVKTWNNATSDIGDHTLIPKASPLYSALASMAGKGVIVNFSGSLVPNDQDGFRELSVTEQGSMTDPEFLFKFEKVGLR